MLQKEPQWDAKGSSERGRSHPDGHKVLAELTGHGAGGVPRREITRKRSRGFQLLLDYPFLGSFHGGIQGDPDGQESRIPPYQEERRSWQCSSRAWQPWWGRRV